MGRKKLPPESVRQKPLRIRLSQAERAQVDEVARRRGYKSTSRWAREQLLLLARQVEPGP
jgi:hypothetical protein